ncbi:MAG: Fe-S cluster domain-containing protein [Paludibacter sp.]|nr:Fe-S cluster domain-containing protein [Bacteroidales bacterium]MCM1069591.1 Fe-S cluster domain-containing protein [Prevotella sp.]MCM1354237.1 Fe-S cluster domain-containing protein [Bacteroides sp.]MCM1443024.1 Fe-S cluster domain-containing protein [Muribaculum sp.]MCM1482311.1 Fe-S cluster domain-containing protein [Paludibacter sp.]
MILISLIVLGVTGLLAAVILYFVAQKFKVEEDPRIDEVTEVLPGANCGGCGFAGCRALAEACVKADTLDGLLCPVGGQETMKRVGDILGMAAAASEPMVAVVRCNGTCSARPKTSVYNGTRTCQIMNSLYVGETNCGFGCLGCGDCVNACQFGALSINQETGLPEVDEDKCTSCGACVKACPRHIIELRKKGPKSRRVYVDCVNKDKGAVARKACLNACIGCGKCMKECPFEAITVENNLAYIDFTKCRLCRKCEGVCPTGAIHAVNFPPRKVADPAQASAPKATTSSEPAQQASKPTQSEATTNKQ